MKDTNETVEIDFVQLHKNGMLDPFIDDLKNLMTRQQEVITEFEDRQSLAPIIGSLQSKVDRWNMLIETGLAFKNKLHRNRPQ